MRRRAGGRVQSKVMLILTEGESEKKYFSLFRGRDRHVSIVPVIAKKIDSKKLLAHCENIVKERGIDLSGGDSVSIVMDVDYRTNEELEELDQGCKKQGYGLYLSNRSFECWLAMHFRALTKPMEQEELENLISKYIKHKYQKSEGIAKYITDAHITSAIKNAECQISETGEYNIECAYKNPSTTVHILVKKLGSW